MVASEGYGPLLLDLEAPNGTFVDGRRIEPYKGVRIAPESVRLGAADLVSEEESPDAAGLMQSP